jgi:hypothetical protein
MIKRLLGTIALGGFIFLFLPSIAGAAKINLSPASVSLTEGQSQVVQVTLDEPIICSDPGPPCQVSLAISTDAPDRVTIDTSPVVIPSNLWAQSFNFTVTAVEDSIVNGNITPIDTVFSTSGSEYYTGFVPTFSITILDNDVAPATPVNQVTSTSSEPRLADTGENFQQYLCVSNPNFGCSLVNDSQKNLC